MKHYLFGFNGKENDYEAKGWMNQVDYGNRIYDVRLGRFLSVDPLQKQFPWLTPYQFSANSPILFIDLDGLEPKEHLRNWKHIYTWAKNDYNDDGFNNYFTLNEKDSKDRPYLVRTKIIGQYPRSVTRYEYYDSDKKDYFDFIPTGYIPDYVYHLNDLKAIGEFGAAYEKVGIIAALAWSSYGRAILSNVDYEGDMDRRRWTTTKTRVDQFKNQSNIRQYFKDNVLTVAVADVRDEHGNTFRLVSLNSATHNDEKAFLEIQRLLKPNEILVPNILGG